MKKTNKALLIVVIVLVLLFGVGQFFISSNVSVAPSSPGTTPPTQSQISPTEVVEYIPPTAASSTPVEKGSCWTSSIAAPYRTDAWRCTVGNSISDPCFQIPSSADLMCGVDPSNAGSSSTFVLELTQLLPSPQTFQGPIPANWAWLVELQGGTLCSPFTGTRPFAADGESASYGCAPGPLGNDLTILGDLNNSTTVWTASIDTFSASTSSLPIITSSSTVPVTEVWQ